MVDGASLMKESGTFQKVPLPVSYNGIKDGPLFQVHEPPGNGNPFFWRVLRDSMNFTAADVSNNRFAREVVTNLASIAASLHTATGDVITFVRPNVAESCRETLGEYEPGGNYSWQLGLKAAIKGLNRGETIPDAKMEQLVCEFHAILTGGSFRLDLPPDFEAEFHNLSGARHMNTSDLVTRLLNPESIPDMNEPGDVYATRQSARDPRMLLVTNAMVLAYAKTMNALNANY